MLQKLLSVFCLVLSSFYLVLAQEVVQVKNIYSSGQMVDKNGIKLESWGGGSISETDELGGEYTLRLTTRNFFSGGYINFEPSRDLEKLSLEYNNLLAIKYKVGNLNVILGGSGTAAKTTEDVSLGNLTTLRCVLVFDDGFSTEMYLPLDTNDAQQSGWRTVGVPLRAFPEILQHLSPLKRIALFGNIPSTIYIGGINIIKDPIPIKSKILEKDMNLALGDEVTFNGSAEDGSSVLKYQWSFNSKNGAQIDAEGRSIKRKFLVPGTYFMTLTVSDIYGLKSASKSHVKVVVNP